MPVTKIEPTDEYPVPYSTADEELDTFADAIAVAGNTAELLVELGANVDDFVEDPEAEKRLLDRVVDEEATSPLKRLPVALGAAAFLRSYGQARAFDAAEIRAALTNKLLEIADCGETKFELKAIELLGKHSDIGLFTERSEINVNYNTPEALEKAIKERVKRLLNAEVIDIKPVGMDLDEELGILDADFQEILAEGGEKTPEGEE